MPVWHLSGCSSCADMRSQDSRVQGCRPARHFQVTEGCMLPQHGGSGSARTLRVFSAWQSCVTVRVLLAVACVATCVPLLPRACPCLSAVARRGAGAVIHGPPQHRAVPRLLQRWQQAVHSHGVLRGKAHGPRHRLMRGGAVECTAAVRAVAAQALQRHDVCSRGCLASCQERLPRALAFRLPGPAAAPCEHRCRRATWSSGSRPGMASCWARAR